MKSPNMHRVAVVVDPAFGDRLQKLSRHVHVWVCDSPENREATESLRADRREHSLDSGFTTFQYRQEDTREEILLGILETIDLHHGEYSHDPAWNSLDVHGTALTARLKLALGEYGVTSFEEGVDGFSCIRIEPAG